MGLGQWLQDDRLDLWDAICVASLDRLTRSLFDFVTLISWLEARGKTLVCIDPNLDMSTPEGQALASVTMTFAQFEREAIAARVRDAYDKLVRDGQYAGGQVPFGYRPVKLSKGWGYEPDPDYKNIVVEMFNRFVGQESPGSITRWLNETGVLTPWNATRKRNGKPLKNAIWKATSVRKILASPAVLGARVTTSGELLRDQDGMVVYRAAALVTRDVFERAQARLRVNPAKAKVNVWALTQVAFCAECESPLYGSTAKYGTKKYMYYCCVHSLQRDGLCTARRIKADELQEGLSRELLRLVGDVELTEGTLIPALDHSEDIIRIADRIGRLFAQIQVQALSGQDVREEQERLKHSQNELAQLHALRVTARMNPVITTLTFRQKWEKLDTSGRNDFLRSAKVRVVVGRDKKPMIECREDRRQGFSEIPRMTVINKPGLFAVIYLGSLVDMLTPASAT